MQFVTKPAKFVLAFIPYVVAIIATFFMMLSARCIDWIYPESKTSVNFMRAILGFNSSPVEMTEKPSQVPVPPPPVNSPLALQRQRKVMGIRIYR